MTLGHFASATAVTAAAPPLHERQHSPTARLTASIEDGWAIMGNANGGYLMSMLARAALSHTERPDVVSMSANFLAPGTPGPIDIDVEDVRIGRRFATVRSTMSHAGEGRPLVTSTVICGEVGAHVGPTRVDVQPPSIPDPAQCPRAEPTETFPPPFVGNIELRMHPDDAAGFTGAPRANGTPRFRGWLRLLDDEVMDTLAVVLAGDALPPPVFNTDIAVGWSPTVQLTVHIHANPSTPWMLIDQRSDIIDGGAFETVATVFDQNGLVVGRARQLQLLALA